MDSIKYADEQMVYVAAKFPQLGDELSIIRLTIIEAYREGRGDTKMNLGGSSLFIEFVGSDGEKFKIRHSAILAVKKNEEYTQIFVSGESFLVNEAYRFVCKKIEG
jgi:hypothetical protein